MADLGNVIKNNWVVKTFRHLAAEWEYHMLHFTPWRGRVLTMEDLCGEQMMYIDEKDINPSDFREDFITQLMANEDALRGDFEELGLTFDKGMGYDGKLGESNLTLMTTWAAMTALLAQTDFVGDPETYRDHVTSGNDDNLPTLTHMHKGIRIDLCEELETWCFSGHGLHLSVLMRLLRDQLSVQIKTATKISAEASRRILFLMCDAMGDRMITTGAHVETDGNKVDRNSPVVVSLSKQTMLAKSGFNVNVLQSRAPKTMDVETTFRMAGVLCTESLERLKLDNSGESNNHIYQRRVSGLLSTMFEDHANGCVPRGYMLMRNSKTISLRSTAEIITESARDVNLNNTPHQWFRLLTSMIMGSHSPEILDLYIRGCVIAFATGARILECHV